MVALVVIVIAIALLLLRRTINSISRIPSSLMRDLGTVGHFIVVASVWVAGVALGLVVFDKLCPLLGTLKAFALGVVSFLLGGGLLLFLSFNTKSKGIYWLIRTALSVGYGYAIGNALAVRFASDKVTSIAIIVGVILLIRYAMSLETLSPEYWKMVNDLDIDSLYEPIEKKEKTKTKNMQAIKTTKKEEHDAQAFFNKMYNT